MQKFLLDLALVDFVNFTLLLANLFLERGFDVFLFVANFPLHNLHQV